MPTLPASTKASLQQRLSARAADLGLSTVAGPGPVPRRVRLRRRRPGHRPTGEDLEPEVLPSYRLRYTGSAHDWGFAIYHASHHDCQDSWLPTGLPFGSCEDALDTACGLYLADPTAWT